MEKQEIKDELFFYILSKLGRYGHEKLPLEIVKDKQSYIVGHRRKCWQTEEEYLSADRGTHTNGTELRKKII